MNKIVVNGFTGAMNKDISKSMMSNTAYLDAQNFRMITTTGSTTGSLETIKGNKLISANTIEAGQFIIDSCEIRDTIVLFTTSNITTTPENESGKSMIYTFTINLETEVGTTPVVIYDDSLNTDDSRLNFSTAYPIKSISRYETPNVQKVYWTDAYNHIRYANIAVPLTVDQEVYSVPGDYMSADKFDFLPKFVPVKPVLNNIVGGKINTGVIAYAYQLYVANGAETAFSPVSDPIHITLDSDFLSNTLTYKGSDHMVNSGKGCILEIDNTSNLGYNRLRLVRVEYETLNALPKISVVNEIEISPLGSTVQVTDVGNVLTELTIDEFNISSTELFKCQDIASKDNRLFAANISKTEFIVDDAWDSRAVRFRSLDSTAYVFNGDDSQIVIDNTFSNWDDYVFNHDGINKFNDSSNDSNSNYGFKYQADGTTLGAEGPNVKIDFVIEEITLDSSHNDATFYAVPPTDTDDLSYTNYASPWKDGKLSWQRDEVYRLFVVFGNDRGQVDSPKWICDLRMPSLHDLDYSDLAYLDISGDIRSTRLFPRVYFKSFPTNATWAQIHRVKRERPDRSVVTQGLVIPSSDQSYNRYSPTSINTANLSTDGAEIIKLVSPEINITKNISKQANDYLDFVTYYENADVVKTPILSTNMAEEIYKFKDNSHLSYNSSNLSDITSAMMVTPKATDSEFDILNNRSYYNYYMSPNMPSKGCSGLLINYENTSWALEGQSYAIVNYKAHVFGSQYGGHSYEDRMSNVTIPCSNVINYTDINNWVGIEYGDTFINYFDVSIGLVDLTMAGGQYDLTMTEVAYVALESSINCDLRHDTSSAHTNITNPNAFLRQEYAGSHTMAKFGTGDYNYDQEFDLYSYNTVYSQQVDVKYGITFNIDKILETNFDCMIKASNIKSNGEMKDSWSKFGVNEFIEVDSLYGAVNAIHNFDNKLYYWQDKAVGIVSVNPRSLIQDNNTSQLVLGTGGVLDRYDYISNYIGCKDKFSVVSSSMGVYWFDRLSKSLFKHANQLMNLTKSKSIQSYMTSSLEDDHLSIAHTDIHNDEVLFTFFKVGETDGFTISFSEPLDAFVSFYGFIPTLYIPYKHRYMTTTSSDYSDNVDREYIFLHDSDIWDRCYFYALTTGVAANYVDSTLEILFNPEYESTKVFDNIFFISNAYSSTMITPTLRANAIDKFEDTFDTIQCYNDYQNTGEVVLTPKINLERRERGWSTFVPRNIVSVDVSDNPNIFTDIYANPATTLYKERMKDKYLIVYFTYHNDGTSSKFVVENVGLKYRTSYR